MAAREAMKWFYQEFGTKIQNAVSGTPFPSAFLVAIGYQETSEIWYNLVKKGFSTDAIVRLCTGDTLDRPKTFPKTADDLKTYKPPLGENMFSIARYALENMANATQIQAYQNLVAKNPNKFCHGFGIFQYDLQFFKVDPDYFLQKRYEDFNQCLTKCITELKAAAKRCNLADAPTPLTDLQLAAIGIAYNAGTYKPNRGLKQGHKVGNRYYGENIFEYIRIARAVIQDSPVPDVGESLLPPPTPVRATGEIYEVDIESRLLVRNEPNIPVDNPKKNVKYKLVDGHLVQSLGHPVINGYLEIETSVNGALIRGFVAQQFLRPRHELQELSQPQPPAPTVEPVIPAVFAPNKSSRAVPRNQSASALSLNENDMPSRTGNTAAERCASIHNIIAWLDVETHTRYQSTDGRTFCNIYAHDFCHLANCYLPRVWWTGSALLQIARGTNIEPRLENTIFEMRANQIHDWLIQFGSQFGWRQTGTLTKLQNEANQGAIALIIAKRIGGERPGHITLVVPEADDKLARRSSSGEVIAPLQSQAGSINFKYSIGNKGWWLNPDKFESFGFWVHA